MPSRETLSPPGAVPGEVRALFLRNFTVQARVGAHDHERGARQRVRLDLTAYLATDAPDPGDRLAAVLDYDRLRQGVLDILGAGHINLLETVAERVCAMCFAHPQVRAVALCIAKPDAHPDCEVGYELHRVRPGASV